MCGSSKSYSRGNHQGACWHANSRAHHLPTESASLGDGLGYLDICFAHQLSKLFLSILRIACVFIVCSFFFFFNSSVSIYWLVIFYFRQPELLKLLFMEDKRRTARIWLVFCRWAWSQLSYTNRQRGGGAGGVKIHCWGGSALFPWGSPPQGRQNPFPWRQTLAWIPGTP